MTYHKGKSTAVAQICPALPVDHICSLPFYCFPFFLLCLLISVISLTLPEQFRKWKAGKKKEEEKKKEKGGKKNCQHGTYRQENIPRSSSLYLYHRIGFILSI
jgi:hypothetical protein